jgi:hypothetical protein
MPNLSERDRSEKAAAPIPPMAVTIPQAAQALSLSVSTIYQLLTDRQLMAVKAKKRTLVLTSSMTAYLAGLPPAEIRMSRAIRRQHRNGQAVANGGR